MVGLRELWNDAIPDAGALADELVRRYGGMRRVAYRERYLIGVLQALDSLEQLGTDPVAVRLAAWFHRAEHAKGNTAGEDAEASARLAEELLPAYGLSPVRVAEVARLVRLTGGDPSGAAVVRTGPDDAGANGDVLLDAVAAVLADGRYSTYASEVRRDSRLDSKVRQQQIRAMVDSERIYRTELAHERYDTAARANLAAELDLLENMTPSVWRGWQRAGLGVLAVLTALVAFAAAALSIGQPWRIPASTSDPRWQAIVMTLLAAAAVGVLWWAVRRTDHKARVVTAGPVAVGLVSLVIILFNLPPENGVVGVGQRVPLLAVTAVLLVLASIPAYFATRFIGGVAMNRGQFLAATSAIVVVVLATVFVIYPVQNGYLLAVNEHLDDQHQPADSSVSSVVNGETLWTRRGRLFRSQTVATAHGIAIASGRGTVEMIDPATGKTRWRYIRADTNDDPRLQVLDSARQLLLTYDDRSAVVLDAGTGKRTAAWPDWTRDYDIQNADPLVTGKTVSKGSDKLYGTNIDGSNRWKFEPGRCTSIGATATADMAVVHLGRSCGSEPDQLVGLDLKSGKQRWIRDSSLGQLLTVGDVVVGQDDDAEKSGELTAVDPRSGEVRWRAEIPGAWACSPEIERTADRVVVFSCPSEAARSTHTVVRFIDAATGATVSTTQVNIPWGVRHVLTTDGRVFVVHADENGCRIAKVTTAVEYVELARPIDCRRGVVAAGNLVLVHSRDSLIALR
ncbi:PQQ-binding-like beta-propeller repeat protein [Kribbella sp. HUAS MG21]|uniref:PQQ-binding-like beta-propeller repeat protein n=1 Tax=Kribbella sp. HUAS MG21 TaxID=3160966 RepID=A0AAU7TN35_9ACTN